MFNQQGSLSSNPQLALNTNQNKNAGLLQQPPKSNILAGFTLPHSVPNPISGAGQSSTIQTTQNETPTPAPTGTPMPAGWNSVGTSSPNMAQTGNMSGLLHPSLTPATPVKSITDGSGNKVDFHATDKKPADDPSNAYNTDTGAKNPNYKDPNAPTPTTPPVTPPSPLSVAGAANNVLSTSSGDTAGKGAAAASGLFGAMGNVAGLQPYSGANEGLDQSFANLSNPQTTSNLNAEEGLFNTKNAIFQNAANTSAAQALQNKSIATQGAENVLGAVQPTQVSPGNTTVSPATNQPLYGLGNTGGNGSNAYQNFSNLQFNTSQGQQYATQANNLSTASNQIDQNFQTLNGVATKYGMNLSNLPTLNTAQQFIMQHGGGAGDVASFNEAMNALQTSIGQIINNSGAFTPTEISSLASQMSAAALSPNQMQQLYDTVKQTAATKINTIQEQAMNAEKAGTNFNNGSPASPNSVKLGGAGNPYENMVQ